MSERVLSGLAVSGGVAVGPAFALAEPIARVLSLGPQPHPYRRIRKDGDAFRLALKDWRVRFRVEGREVVVKKGEVLHIPSNVPHMAVALEDTLDLDIFSPPRQDWLDGTDHYLRGK